MGGVIEKFKKNSLLIISIIIVVFVIVFSLMTWLIPVNQKNQDDKKQGYIYQPPLYGCKCKSNIQGVENKQCECDNKRDNIMNTRQVQNGNLYPKNSTQLLEGMSHTHKLKHKTVTTEHT